MLGWGLSIRKFIALCLSPIQYDLYSTIFSELKACLQVFNTMTTMSFSISPSYGSYADSSRDLKPGAPEFFKMNWCTVWIDEAHEFRTVSRSFIGAVQLRKVAYMMNACTATPLFTKPEVSTVNFKWRQAALLSHESCRIQSILVVSLASLGCCWMKVRS